MYLGSKLKQQNKEKCKIPMENCICIFFSERHKKVSASLFT